MLPHYVSNKSIVPFISWTYNTDIISLFQAYYYVVYDISNSHIHIDNPNYIINFIYFSIIFKSLLKDRSPNSLIYIYYI
jgi:hypothetical protein